MYAGFFYGVKDKADAVTIRINIYKVLIGLPGKRINFQNILSRVILNTRRVVITLKAYKGYFKEPIYVGIELIADGKGEK